MKLPMKTRIASYLMIIIGGLAIPLYSASIGANYKNHLPFLAASIILFAILLLLLKKKWSWYGLIISILLWLIGSLFSFVSLTDLMNGDFFLSIDVFLVNSTFALIPLILLLRDYKAFPE